MATPLAFTVDTTPALSSPWMRRWRSVPGLVRDAATVFCPLAPVRRSVGRGLPSCPWMLSVPFTISVFGITCSPGSTTISSLEGGPGTKPPPSTAVETVQAFATDEQSPAASSGWCAP